MKCVGLHDETVSILIGGEAGQGVTRGGSLLGKALMIQGLEVFGTIDYPSLIRGGHNFYVVRACTKEVNNHMEMVDLLVALNKETVLIHIDEVYPNGVIIVDEETEFEEGDITRNDIEIFRIPLSTIVKDLEGPVVMRNTVALGAALGILGLDADILMKVVAETFATREKIAEMNKKAIERGHHYASENFKGFQCRIEGDMGRGERLWLTGNEAVTLGAIQAGCKFYAAYPMTPASPILHYLFQHDKETGMVVIQPESELAAMNMVVGAGYSGVRAMTATSGGGFCLMTEALGLAGMTEVPVVVNIAQRTGPSTGLATYTAQSDLLFTINASQGEFPRVVIAPGDVDQCFYQTMEAFNLAEMFQIPVIILTDKHVAESHKSTKMLNLEKVPIDRGKLLEIEEWVNKEEYKRFRITEDGISPRLIPGTRNALKLVNSNEHVEYGFTTSDPDETVAMVDKRMSKIPLIKEAVEDFNPIRLYGSEDPDITLFFWGSTKGPALEALKLLEKDDIRAKLVQILYLEPFPADLMSNFLMGEDDKLLLENNRTAQLGKLIKMHNCYIFENTFLKYDARQFYPSEIAEKVREVLK